ncbi:MAG: alpha/beta-hydrolase family protein [Actinomycetota bacterium]
MDNDCHRYFLLSHHEDPITRFGPALAVQQPSWLGPPEARPPGVPRLPRWHPLTTFFLTGIDMINAMHVVPGSFMARGHDYRADLARMVSVAFGLPVDEDELMSIERALRRREAEWADRRRVAEQLLRARETAKRMVRVPSISGGS